MKKYFYSDGKEKKGPFSFEEMKNEVINQDTLIWYEGLGDWTSIKEIKEFEEILQLSPPPINIKDTKVSSGNNSDSTNINTAQIHDNEKSSVENNWEIESIIINHPWRRFFARTIDLFTTGLLMLMLCSYFIGMTFPDNIDNYIKFLENPIGAAIALYLLWIPTETLFLFFIGTTPAKWLFGIHVKSQTGENLSFSQSLKRAFQAFVYGDGFAIPLITLFTRIYSYRKLVNKGRTSWDSNVGSIIFYEEWSTIKIVASVLVTLSTFVLIGYLNS